MSEEGLSKSGSPNHSVTELQENYFIHNNGGRPFNVFPTKTSSGKYEVSIYKRGDLIEEKWTYTELAIPPILAEKVFIGESPKNEMTEFSGGYGPEFKGNSILLQISKDKKEYVFIGQDIFSFQSLFEIVDFVSPVGNSDVPYPYAVDTVGNYYLLIEDVVLKVPDGKDPYRYYYVKCSITAQIISYRDNGEPIPRELFIKNFEGITKFYIGDEPYELTYHADPKEHYESWEISDDFGPFSVDKTDGKRYILSKSDYIDLIKRYGELAGFSPLKILLG